MKPRAVLGLATGSTPIGMYKQMIEWYKKGDLDFSQVTSVNLDEYKGLSGDNDQSYRYFMNTNLFDHVNIDKSRTYVPNGLEKDSEKACADYNEIIRSVGGVDMQLLGIGGNGHIGFNRIKQVPTHCLLLFATSAGDLLDSVNIMEDTQSDQLVLHLFSFQNKGLFLQYYNILSAVQYIR